MGSVVYWFVCYLSALCALLLHVKDTCGLIFEKCVEYDMMIFLQNVDIC